jgi:hypothetical protein
MFKNPSPILNLWKGFKIFTIVFAQFYAIIMLASAMIMLNFPMLSLFMAMNAGMAYWCGKSITHSIADEERRAKWLGDSDDSTEDTSGPV